MLHNVNAMHFDGKFLGGSRAASTLNYESVTGDDAAQDRQSFPIVRTIGPSIDLAIEF
jgi:hypothetical protein